MQPEVYMQYIQYVSRARMFFRACVAHANAKKKKVVRGAPCCVIRCDAM